MRNIVIVTEDTGFGKKLFRKISKELYNNNIAVYSTALRSDDSGGNKKFCQKVEQLIEEGAIKHGYIVVLAVDNIVYSNMQLFNKSKNEQVVSDNCKQLSDDIRKSKYKIRRLGDTAVHITDYASIEAAVLSYIFLWDITTPVNYAFSSTAYETELLNLYRQLHKRRRMEEQTKQGIISIYYYEVLLKYARKHKKTAEGILSDMLNAVTKRNRHADFEITKKSMGICWYIGCLIIRKLQLKKKINCDNCAVEKEKNFGGIKSGKTKLESLIYNSDLRDIFNFINEYGSTPSGTLVSADTE